MYKEKIFNVATGEETLRDYTPEEIAEVEKARAEAEAEAQARAETEAEIKVKRDALLARLGITEEEAKLLLS